MHKILTGRRKITPNRCKTFAKYMQSSRKWCKAFVSRHKRSQTDLKENHNIAELVQKFLCPVFQWLLSCVSPRASEWLSAPLNVGEPSLHARRSKSADMGLVGKKERCPVNKNKHRCRNIIQRIKCCGLVLISYKSRTGSSDVSGAVCPALSSRTCLRVFEQQQGGQLHVLIF